MPKTKTARSAVPAITKKDGPIELVTVAVPPGGPDLKPDSDLLAAFVYPLTLQEFMGKHYCEHSVAWIGGGMGRLRGILDDFLHRGNTAALVRNTSSDAVHCWLRRTQSSVSLSNDALDSLKLEDPAQALTAHAGGASLYMRSPPEMHEAFIPALSDCLGMAWAGYYDPGQTQPTGEIEIFVSHAGHTTGWHTDFQSNFTLQVRACVLQNPPETFIVTTLPSCSFEDVRDGVSGEAPSHPLLGRSLPTL